MAQAEVTIVLVRAVLSKLKGCMVPWFGESGCRHAQNLKVASIALNALRDC